MPVPTHNRVPHPYALLRTGAVRMPVPPYNRVPHPYALLRTGGIRMPVPTQPGAHSRALFAHEWDTDIRGPIIGEESATSRTQS
jgi:hypothetical protein